MLNVTEYFPSIQGEGIHSGKSMYFLRVAKCNLRCTFCDTKYAMAEGEEMSIGRIYGLIMPFKDFEWLEITGGEPLLQDLLPLLIRVKGELKMKVTVETNGTIPPEEAVFNLVDLWTVSPKLKNSEMLSELKIDVLRNFALYSWKVQFKFVVNSDADMDEAIALLNELHFSSKVDVIFQPMARPDQNVLGYLSNYESIWKRVQTYQVKYPKYKMRALPQLHWLLYGQRRGV